MVYELFCRLVLNYVILFIIFGIKLLEVIKVIEEFICISWRGKFGVYIDIGCYISFVMIFDL